MDKRQSPRYAVTLDALVHPAHGRSWLCTLRDFCVGGMLLAEKEGGRGPRSGLSAKAGESVGLHFTVPADPGDHHFRLEGNVVRVMDSAVGLSFPQGVPEDVMTALLEYSNKSFDLGEDDEDEEDEAVPEPKEPVQKVTEAGKAPAKKAAARKAPAKKAAARKAPAKKAAAGQAPARKAAATKAPATKAAPQKKAAAERQPEARPGAKSSVAGAAARAKTPSRGESPGKAPQGQDEALKGTAQITRKQALAIVAECRKRVVRILPEMNAAFFDFMDNELLAIARSARSNDLQNEYFNAMSVLEKAKTKVGQSFANDVLDQIDNPQQLTAVLEKRRQREGERHVGKDDRVRLSLVNTEEFEDWLAVANIVARTERMYTKYLIEIQSRLGMLVSSWGHNEVNPLGPAVFSRAFDDAIRDVDLTKEVRERIYHGYETTVVPLFRRLYMGITELLESSKLFPDLDEDFVSPVHTNAPSPEPESLEPAEPEPEQEPELEQEPGSEAGEEATPQAREQVDPRPRQPSAPRPTPRGAPGRIPPRRPAPSPTARGQTEQTLRKIYSTVKTLLDENTGEAVSQDDYGEQELYQLGEIQNALSELQNDHLASPTPLTAADIQRQILGALEQEGSGKRIAPAMREGMAVVDNLLNTFESDSLLSGSARDWIGQLGFTLNKVAAVDQDFLDQETPHQAMEVIDQLARLGASDSGGVKRSVDRIVKGIVENFDDNEEVFDEALTELEPLLDRQNRAYAGNVQRTVKASEGQQVLRSAQTAVVDEMSTRLSGEKIPDVIMKLLVPGWRNLMVNTHLRQGKHSPEWNRNVNVIDQLLLQLDKNADASESPNYIPPEQLLEEIETGLDSISYEPGQRAPLINSLKRVIEDDVPAEELNLVELPETGVAGAMGLGAIEQAENKKREILEANETHPDWHGWSVRVSQIHVGEWLEFQSNLDEGDIGIVTWVADNGENFVFVNRRGVKTHEFMCEELTEMLLDGRARILEEAEIPASDRASHRMLQNMHNQLTHQATHDTLTGLGNRKEFERQVEMALADARRYDQQHLIANLDLDQFKVINTTSGYEAGDALLANIARLMEDAMPTMPHYLSRLGGNDFGVLLQNCTVAAGQAAVEELCDAIRDYRFEWEDSHYTLTASAGCVVVDKSVDDVDTLLQAADSARFAAKDAGRDRIQFYDTQDTELAQRHGIMEFVSQIDQALEQDRFVLNCQKIAPIDPNPDHAHYEILLTVLDANDNPMPPQDFIVAAETYNRMGAIDRWVIKNAFQWIAANILKLDHLGAFSINVSGNSLNEADFMDFVLEQFNETRLPTSKICFEITETAAISSLAGAIDFMQKMKVIGVEFSLDDFGSGLSSYSYLRDLPVDYLKIDGIFVKDIKTNPNDFAVVKSINEIGHFMGKKTIAEYVEDEEVLEMLRGIGVDFAQGYGIEKKRVLDGLV